MANYAVVRQQIFDMVRKAVAADLIYLSAGNISVRVGNNALAITPSGIAYDDLHPEQIAIMSLDGTAIDAPYAPSSEMPMHSHILQKFDRINAIIHTHSSYAVTFAMLGETIPVANLELFFVGAPIPVAPWACPGTLSAGIEAATLLGQQTDLEVVLLRNHGLIAVGETLQKAFTAALSAECGLRAYHQSLQVGQPNILSQEQIDEIRERYK